MPVEIREIVIKTEITVGGKSSQRKWTEKDLATLRRQLIEEMKAISNREHTWKKNHKR
jgi:hypothetical protein